MEAKYVLILDFTIGCLNIIELTDEEIAERLKSVKHPESDVDGWLKLYQKLVQSADSGAILR